MRFQCALLNLLILCSVSAAPAGWLPEKDTASQTVALRNNQQTMNFQLILRNAKYQAIPLKAADGGTYSATDQFRYSRSVTATGEKTQITWNAVCENPTTISSAYISCRFPAKEWKTIRFSAGDAEFRLPETAGEARLWRGNAQEVQFGSGDARTDLLLSRKCFLELYDLRVWNSPVYELRIYLGGKAADFRKGRKLDISIQVCNSADFILNEGATTIREIHPVSADWTPFSIGWEETATPVWDFSSHYDAPAGKHGFLQVVGPIFQFPNGKRLRMWGVNVASTANFPTREEAPKVVSYLKRLGINAVRFAHLDSTWYKSLIDYRNKRELAYHEDNFDKFFFFLNELRKAGIYYVLDGRHGFEFMTDEFSYLDRFWRNRGCNLLLYFSSAMQQHHKKYLKKLLLTRNPYSGLALADDPALAGLQMLNETFLIRNGDYVKTQENIPEPLQKEFIEAWQRWTPRLTGPKPAHYNDSTVQQRREFFSDLERRYFQAMYRYYRDELKVKSPIASTSCYIGYSALPSAADGEYTEGHSYYSLPQDEDLLSDDDLQLSGGRKLRLARLPDSPGYRDNSYLRWLPFSLQQRIGYQPYVMGEWNHVHPFPERFDGPLWMALLSNRQDFDGMFLFTIAHSPWETIRERNCDVLIGFEDPSTIINMIPAALVWHEQQITPAEKTLEVRVPQQDIFRKPSESYMLYGENVFSMKVYNCPESRGMRHLPNPDQVLEPQQRLKEVNPSLFRQTQAHSPVEIHPSHVIVNSPRFLSIFGELGGKKLTAGILSVTAPEGEEYSVSLNSLDQKAIENSGRVLVSICPVSLAQGSSFIERIDNKSGKRLGLWMLKRKRNQPMVKPFSGTLSIRGDWNVYQVSNAGSRGNLLYQSDSTHTVQIPVGGKNPVFFYLLEARNR